MHHGGRKTEKEKKNKKSIKALKSNTPYHVSIPAREESADKQDRIWYEGLISAGVGGLVYPDAHL